MAISGIARAEIVIGHAANVGTDTSGAPLVDAQKLGLADVDVTFVQTWFTPIDNIPDLVHFASIDAQIVSGQVQVSWKFATGVNAALLRLAVYVAYE
jgi:hypothetical protein